MTTGQHRDVVVVGAGVGGLVAAALLTNVGRRVLVVERDTKVGGRASTEEVDGFRVNTGAALWEFGGVVEETCRLVGVPFDVREPPRSISVRSRGREVCIDRIFGSPLQRTGLRALARRKPADPETPVSEWLRGFTRNAALHRAVRNLCCGALAANADDLPAAVFLSYFSKESAFGTVGICPEGMIGPMRALAGYVERGGGEIWLGAEADAVVIEAGMAQAVRVRRAGETIEVPCEAVVSNAGPKGTATLAGRELPQEYLDRVDALEPCAMLTVNFGTRAPLSTRPSAAGLLMDTEVLYGLVAFTPTCPEMSPPGWNLYTAWGVPRNATGDFDSDAAMEETLSELHREFDGFRDARILSTRVMRDAWPAQHAMAGSDLPRATPIPNLWNVGDGVKDYATGGTQACAASAERVVKEMTALQQSGTPVRTGA